MSGVGRRDDSLRFGEAVERRESRVVSDGNIARPPELGEARSLVALTYALVARVARAIDEGEPLPNHPNRLM